MSACLLSISNQTTQSLGMWQSQPTSKSVRCGFRVQNPSH